MTSRQHDPAPTRPEPGGGHRGPGRPRDDRPAGDVMDRWQAGSRDAADAALAVDGTGHLPAPDRVVAVPGVGHVTLDWDPVDGAIGYQVLGGGTPDDLEVLDHGGGDLLAVPRPPYVDTTGRPGQVRHYAVAALATVEDGHGPTSRPVAATPAEADGDRPVVTADVVVDAPTTPLVRSWWMIGAEHVSQLGYVGGPGPDTIGAEYATALARMHDEVGVTHVRAHAILDDENGVVVEHDGRVGVDPTTVIDLYTRLGKLGLRPVVELGFMPTVLASDPDRTVFTYEGIISPPTDWSAWGRVVGDLVTALVDHFGVEEVRQWPFEVWNEPNLDVFWTGTPEDYLHLYDVTARAVKEVDDRLLVGGPATAAVGWIGGFLDHVVEAGTPLDFLTTHVYGVPPLDLRPALAVRGLDDVEVWWTEWGITPTHFHRVNDAAFGAPFVLAGMKAATEVADALAYWVATDHFEELGRPPSLLHGGFGLQTVGNLRKPRYWALALASQQGDDELPLVLDGDGGGGLVDGWATRHEDGTVDVLLWNGTLDQSRVDGDPALDRTVTITVAGGPGPRHVSVARVDRRHSDLATRLRGDEAGDGSWPDPDRWADLQAADRLHVEDWGRHEPDGGELALDVDLPMPGVVRVRLAPEPPGDG